MSTFSFHCLSVSQSFCNNIYSHQKPVGTLPAPHAHQYSVLQQHLVVVLICIFKVTNDGEYLIVGPWRYFYHEVPLWDGCVANTVYGLTQSLLMVSFVEKEFLMSLKCNLSTFLIVHALCVLLKTLFSPKDENIVLCFLLEIVLRFCCGLLIFILIYVLDRQAEWWWRLLQVSPKLHKTLFSCQGICHMISHICYDTKVKLTVLDNVEITLLQSIACILFRA